MCTLTACWAPLFVRLSCTNYLIVVYEKTGLLIALRMELALRWSCWCSKARSALASWSIDWRCVQEAKAFPWDEPLGLNRGTTDGACFFVFAVLSLAHDSNCLVVEWDTFWFGFNHPLEICWVTPSLATVFMYLLEYLGFDLNAATAPHFCLLNISAGASAFTGVFLLFIFFVILQRSFFLCFTEEANVGCWVFVVILLFASLPWNQRGVSSLTVRPYAEPSVASLHLSEQWYHELTWKFLSREQQCQEQLRRTCFLD